LTQSGFCPRCGQIGPLHEFHKDVGTYRRFKKPYEKPPMYCERCIDSIKRQQAISRKEAAMRRYEWERKYGKGHHAR